MPMVKNGTEEIEAGLVDEGGMIDEESGNDVPNGALKEEVRDDQPAMLSPGEFVMPAYAVRYFGVENLVKMLRAAKQGMEQLDDLGLTGEPNSDDAGLETAVLPSEMQEKGATPTLAVGGMPTIKPGAVTTTTLTNQPTQQTQFGVAPPAAIQPAAQPAAVQPLNFAAPSPLTQQMYRPTAPIRFPGQQNVTYPEYIYSPTPGGTGYGVAEYVGPNGQSIFVTTINGKPIGQVPEGYVTRAEYTEKQKEGKTTTPPTELQRKPEDMDPGISFEPPTGEEGDQDLSAENTTNDQINGWITALEGGKEAGKEDKVDAKDIIPAIINPTRGLTTLAIKGITTLLNNADKSGKKAEARQFMTKDNKFITEDKWDKLTDKEKAETLKNLTTGNYIAPITEEGQAGSVGSSENWGTVQTTAPGKSGYITPAEAAAAALTGRTVAIVDAPPAPPAVDAPSFDAPSVSGISGGEGYGGAPSGSGGFGGFSTTVNKGGLISMANGGMITVGDKTYSPEDFGFASKGALVKKRKTPAKKKRGKGLASSK
jgi:hypothetical protein